MLAVKLNSVYKKSLNEDLPIGTSINNGVNYVSCGKGIKLIYYNGINRTVGNGDSYTYEQTGPVYYPHGFKITVRGA